MDILSSLITLLSSSCEPVNYISVFLKIVIIIILPLTILEYSESVDPLVLTFDIAFCTGYNKHALLQTSRSLVSGA